MPSSLTLSSTIYSLLLIWAFSAMAQNQSDSGPMFDLNPFKTASNPAQKCISDICGPPAQSDLYTTKHMDRVVELVTQTDPKQTEFSPEISKMFADFESESQKQNNMRVPLLEKSLHSSDNKEIEGGLKARHNYLFLLKYFPKIQTKPRVENGKTTLVVDKEATMLELNKIDHLSREDKQWLIKATEYISKISSDSSLSESIDSLPAKILLRKLYPGVSVTEAIKLEADRARQAAFSVKGLDTAEKQQLFFQETSAERLSFIISNVEKGTADENQFREILKWNANFKNNIYLIKNVDNPFLSRKIPSFKEIVSKAGGEAVILRIDKQKRDQSRQEIQRDIQNCKVQYFLNKGLLPTSAQVENLKKDIARSKQMVNEMIKTKFPPAMHQRLIQAVNDSDFILPSTFPEYKTNLTSYLKQNVESQKENTAMMGPKTMRNFVVLLAQQAGEDQQKQDENKQSNDNSTQSNKFCEPFHYAPLSDRNYTAQGSIILSYSTATGDEKSRLAIIAHELGHSISEQISAMDARDKMGVVSVQKCLNDQHTEELPPKTQQALEAIKKGNPHFPGVYVEEDFADTIAAEATKGVPGKNPWCQLLSLSPGKQQYAESTMQAQDGESHSSELFRLINIEMMKKGSVPESCRAYYKKINYQERFSACFDLINSSKSSLTKEKFPEKATK